MDQWDIRKDGRLLLAELHEIKKKENETVRFNLKFHKLIDKMPNEVKPKNGAVLLYYVNVFEGSF